MFISNAYAAPAAFGGDLMSFLPMVVIFVLFYFMLIRPQLKQAKQQKAMIEALKAGDEVATTGGIVGKVTKVNDGFVSIEIAANTVVNVQKHTIQTLLPPGTIKSI
jgi:preprotein translocase subunit YajC